MNRGQALRRVVQHADGWLGRASGALLAGLVVGWIWSPAGLAAGYLFDRRRRLAPFRERGWESLLVDPEHRLFVIACCACMGHVAKADGRVSRAEIAVAERVFELLELDDDARSRAIRLFTQGKQPGFPLAAICRQVRRRLPSGSALRERFLEYQAAVALADGTLHPAVRACLLRIARGLGQGEQLLQEILRRAARPGGLQLRPVPQSPYRLLGVSDSASDEEIRRAYRRIVSRHHPDRLQANGLDEVALRAGAGRILVARRAVEAIRREREGGRVSGGSSAP